MLSVDERVDCSISKFGDINKFEVIGIVNFTATDPAKTNVAVKLNLSNFGSKLKFRIPPDFDKQAWAKEKIFKSSGQGFKPQTRIDALIYKYSSKEESDLPFTLNVWHSKGAGNNIVTIEIERNQENLIFPLLQNVVIIVHVGDKPNIESLDNAVIMNYEAG